MKTRFGVLGTGVWADACHAAGLAAHPDVELVGVWGRDAAKAAQVAERHGSTGFSDLDSLLSEVDAVAIAVTPTAQPELAIRAAEAGSHLLLEKPLALSTVDAARIVAAVQQAGVSTITNFTFHFLEPVAAWLRDTVLPAEWEGGTFRLMASILGSGGPFGDSTWRQEERMALWDAAPHVLSLMLPALGKARRVTVARGRGETMNFAIEHEPGGLSSATVSLTVPEPAEQMGFEVWGASGVNRCPEEADDDAEVRGYAAAVSQLLTAIETGVQPVCDIALSAEIVEVLERLDRAFAEQPPSP